MLRRRITILVLSACLPALAVEKVKVVAEQAKGWPVGVKEVRYFSDADKSMQPAMFYSSGSNRPKPLLVGFHTWSSDYTQKTPDYAKWCIANDWVLIYPHFRGPNKTPPACGSELMVQDIISAVRRMQETQKIDASRIYCMGVSGGGHASMLMAGRAPEIWAGVSAWCGISDLATWHKQRKKDKYAKMMEGACGGAPGSSAKVDTEFRNRSPVTWLEKAQKVNLDLNHGNMDGRKGSVPFTHTLYAFNAVVPAADRIPTGAIDQLYETMAKGPALPEDVFYGKRRPLFRKTSGNTRVTVFAGGHEVVFNAGLNWLANQRKGTPAVWEIKPVAELKSSDKAMESGK